MRRGTRPFLLGLNVLLLCVLAWRWVDRQGHLRAIHWQPPAAIRPDFGSLSAPIAMREDAEVARYMVILDRPVFSPSRRPVLVPKNGAPPRPDPLDGVHLYGFFKSAEGGGIIARVDGKTRRIRQSESIGDWTLMEIRNADVVFSRAGASRVIPLVQAKQAQGAAPALPPAPPVQAVAVPVPAATPSAQPPSGQLPIQAAEAAAKPSTAPKPSSGFVIGGSR